MTASLPWVARGYLAVVSLAGFGLLAATMPAAARTARDEPLVVLLLTAFMVAADLRPIQRQRRGTVEWLTLSSPFAFALLLGWGMPASVLALSIASAVGDLVQRKELYRTAFNASQTGIALAVAGALYEAFATPGVFGVQQLPAFLLAGFIFHVLNGLVLTGVALALIHGRNPLPYVLQKRVLEETWTTAMMLGMSPIILVIAERSLLLLPLLALPMAAVYLACREAVHAEERRVQAEAVARKAEEMAEREAQLREAEQALVRELQEQDRIKSELLAAVSHEFRTPLTAVLTTLQLLEARGDRIAPEQRRELIRMAVQEGQRLSELIKELLLAARFEHGPREHVAYPIIDAGDVLKQVGEAAHVSHPERPVETVVRDALPVRASIDFLLRILGQLLDNAVKFTPEGSPIRLEGGRQGDLAVLAVSDEGPGIPEADRERIFERFTQLDASNTREAGGVGLGLYIARQLARAQGGELLLAERDGPGARFELRLPLVHERERLAEPSFTR